MIVFLMLAFLTVNVDDDAVLLFFWNEASGNVDYYNVYASVNDGEFNLAGSSTTGGIAFYHSPIGDKIVVRVQAIDKIGDAGPISEASKPIYRVVKKQLQTAKSP